MGLLIRDVAKEFNVDVRTVQLWAKNDNVQKINGQYHLTNDLIDKWRNPKIENKESDLNNLNNIGIYKITCPNGKHYIGQSQNIRRRFKQYQSLNCYGTPKIYKSLNDYGVDKHKFEILENCEVKNLNSRERFYQEKFNSVENGLNSVYTSIKGKSYNKPIKKYIKPKISIFKKIKDFIYSYYLDWVFFAFFIPVSLIIGLAIGEIVHHDDLILKQNENEELILQNKKLEIKNEILKSKISDLKSKNSNLELKIFTLKLRDSIINGA